MKYYMYEEIVNGKNGRTYLELDDGYARRQISKFENNYIASNRKDFQYDFCLSEGYIDKDDLGENVMEIASMDFEYIWDEYCQALQDLWKETKFEFNIGKEVIGNIEVFYPQGVIISIKEDVLGVANYYECKDSTTVDKMYPTHKVKGVVI